MKNNDRLLKSAIAAAVTLAHVGIGAWAWETAKPQEPLSVDNMTFVDLGTLDGDDKPAAEGAPAPLEDKPAASPPKPEPPKPKPEPEKPKPKPEPPKVVEPPKVKAVVRDDVPADVKAAKPVEPPKPKPEPKPPELEKPKPQPERELKPEPAKPAAPSASANSSSQAQGGANNPNAVHRAENGTGGGGSDPNSKVPSNNAGGEKGGDGKGRKGDGKAGGGGGGSGVADGGYITLPQPNYPRSAMENEEEGTVKLSVLVEANGKVSDVKVTKSSGSAALDNAAKRAARTATYKPKSQNGEPMRTRFNTSFTFKLDS